MCRPAHDVDENTKFPSKKIAEQLGPDVARLVEGVTKISELDLLAPRTGRPKTSAKCFSPW